MKYILYLLIIFISLLSSCIHSNEKGVTNTSEISSALDNKYAQGFSIYNNENGYILNVFNPWQDAKDVQYKYLLTHNADISQSSVFNEVIPIPVSRIVCLSTTHIAYIDLLNNSESIVGVSGAGFVSSPNVRQMIDNGLVKDVGFEQAINYELLVSLKPQVVFTYGVGAEMAGYLQKLRDLKIPVVFIGDYLEENPLGKAEWLKVFGLFTGEQTLADSLFNEIDIEYNSVANSVAHISTKPKVFLNIPWKDVWYMPGGEGYMAKLIDDAAGNYLLSHLKGSNSYPFSLESALESGMDADIWINTGSVSSIDEIVSEHPILKTIPALTNGAVYNNNKRTNLYGGNDFWESGVVNPHIILKDLVEIFHPDSIEHQLVYYQQLK
jgi:iron complex transport system substrate-binding protein